MTLLPLSVRIIALFSNEIFKFTRPVRSIQSESIVCSFCQPVSVFQFVVTLIPLEMNFVLNSNATIDGSRLELRSSAAFTPKITRNLENVILKMKIADVKSQTHTSGLFLNFALILIMSPSRGFLGRINVKKDFGFISVVITCHDLLTNS